MFKLMGKEINAVLGAQTILIWTYVRHLSSLIKHTDLMKKPRVQSYDLTEEAQWLSGIVLDSRPKDLGFEPHRRHCVVSLSKNINPSLILVQPRKTRPYINERSLMGCKESNQTNKTI